MDNLEELAKTLYQESQQLGIINHSANWEYLTEGKDAWMALAAKCCEMPNVPHQEKNEIKVAGGNCSLTLKGVDVVSIVGDTALIKVRDACDLSQSSMQNTKLTIKELIEIRDLVNGK